MRSDHGLWRNRVDSTPDASLALPLACTTSKPPPASPPGHSLPHIPPLSPPHTHTQTKPQVGFKRELIKEVKAFVVDAQMFRKDWEASGPMVPGLDPMEATDRLRKFQQMFEVGGCWGGEGWRGRRGLCGRGRAGRGRPSAGQGRWARGPGVGGK